MRSINQRDVVIDIIKGVGIVFMVLGHCGSPITSFIYLFHMAVFFIASGYCYKSKHSDSAINVVSFIKRKMLVLWLPYVLWTTLFSIFHNFFVEAHIYEGPSKWTVADITLNIVKAIFLRGGTQMGGALWFVAILMQLSIAYCILDFVLKKIIRDKNTVLVAQMIISIVFLLLGYICSLQQYSFLGLDKVLSYYVLFHGGVVLQKMKFRRLERNSWAHLVILAISFTILFFCVRIDRIALDENRYGNPLFFLFVSFVGWQFCYETAYFINKWKIFEKIMVCLGQNTMAIVILHFLCFKIVSYVGVMIKGEPISAISEFPVLYKNGYWWLAYLFVGVTIPVLASLFWKQFSSIIKERKSRIK